MFEASFVNPYAFLPLPAEVRRREPGWHTPGERTDGAAVVSGVIDVRWRLETPLLLPSVAKEEGWIRPDGSIRLPGSSIKGAVRSLHEALFNGCLRIVDEEFVPGYREPAERGAEDRGWRLARVCEDLDGQPTEFQLCKEETFWVDGSELAKHWTGKGSPRTGSVVRIDGSPPVENLGRKEVREVYGVKALDGGGQAGQPGEEPSTRAEAGSHVFIVTHVGVRKKRRRDGTVARCSWATGELTGEFVAFDPTLLDQSAWAEFGFACAGTRDRSVLEQDDAARAKGDRGTGLDRKAREPWRRQTVYEPVKWPDTRGGEKVIGERALQSGFLFTGDVVWVKVVAGRVTGIRLSRIWRRAGRGSVGDRLARVGVQACQPRPKSLTLCLTCSLFGAAETRGSTPGDGEQSAYGGHVRFSSARSNKGVPLRSVDLVPLGTPSPGAGMFYLRLPSELGPGAIDEIPSHWGSEADTPHAELNGRKFYWHHNPDSQARYWSDQLGKPVAARYEASLKQKAGKMSRTALLVPAGTIFKGSVSFDQISVAELESVLAAMDPSRVERLMHGGKPGRAVAVRIGGGKPVGFGSASVTIEDVRAHALSDLYWDTRSQGAPVSPRAISDEPVVSAEGMMSREAAIALNERVGRFTGNIPKLAYLLDLKALGDLSNYVSYPPGAEWGEYGSDAFRESFAFFQEANGQQLVGHRRRWRILPEVDPSSSPSIPITLPRKRGGRR